MVTSSSIPDLLATASKVLLAQGFDVTTQPLVGSGSDWLLAENEHFLVAVLAGAELDDLHRLEAAAVPELAERILANPVAGPKRWDTYVVLVSSATPDHVDEERSISKLTSDTHGVRRLVSVAALPTVEHLERVLRPFVPLRRRDDEGLTDAFAALEAQLVLNGIDKREAERAVTLYKRTGSLTRA